MLIPQANAANVLLARGMTPATWCLPRRCGKHILSCYEKAVKIAINRIYRGEYSIAEIEEVEETEDEALPEAEEEAETNED